MSIAFHVSESSKNGEGFQATFDISATLMQHEIKRDLYINVLLKKY